MAQIQHSDPVWSSLRRTPDDPRPPAALVLGIAFAALLGWAGVSGLLSLPTAIAVGGALVVATVASWWLTAPGAVVSAALTFLVVDGFVLGTLGDLGWNGMSDAALLVVLVVACVTSAEARREVDLERAQRSGINKP
jgi:hypothetical protein